MMALFKNQIEMEAIGSIWIQRIGTLEGPFLSLRE
jgi:hypothetical protein